MLEEALDYYQAGDYPSAVPLFREMLADEPDNVEVLYILALCLQRMNEFGEAGELLDRAIRGAPENEVLHIARGSVQVQAGEFDQAERSFKEAVRLDANRIEAQNGLAFVQLALGRAGEAEQTLRHALKAEPDNLQSLVNMGIALYRQSRFEKAINYLKEALAAEPSNAVAHAYLGRAFMGSGNPGFAIQCFENAIDEAGESAEVLRWLAEAQVASGQLEEAAESYRRLSRMEGENAPNLFGLARVEKRLGNLKHAEQLFLRGLLAAPDDREALFDFCELLLAQSRHQEAERRLRQSGVMDNPPPRALYLMARARLAAGKAGDALDLLRPLIASGDLSDDMRLLLATTLLETGEAEAADQQIDRLLERENPAAGAVILRGERLLKEGRTGEAAELLKSTQRRHDLSRRERRRVSRLLAQVLDAEGQHQAAFEQFQALDRPPPAVVRIRSEKPPQKEKSEPAETAMNREVTWSWPARAPDDRCPDPVFVFGWPGSGREQLLRALAGSEAFWVPQDRVSEQRERRWLVSFPQGRAPLEQLDAARIRLLRRRYHKMLRRLDPPAGDRAVVDALWLRAEALPTIYRLFPTARILVITREPKDMLCVWMQTGYEDLPRMAAGYAGELRVLERCMEAVPLEYLTIRAQDLAADPEAVLQNLCSDLSVDWDPAIGERLTAALRDEPLQAGVWEAYAEWLKPAIDAFQSRDGQATVAVAAEE